VKLTPQLDEARTGYRHSTDTASRQRVRDAINASIRALPDFPEELDLRPSALQQGNAAWQTGPPPPGSYHQPPPQQYQQQQHFAPYQQPQQTGWQPQPMYQQPQPTGYGMPGQGYVL